MSTNDPNSTPQRTGGEQPSGPGPGQSYGNQQGWSPGPSGYGQQPTNGYGNQPGYGGQQQQGHDYPQQQGHGYPQQRYGHPNPNGYGYPQQGYGHPGPSPYGYGYQNAPARAGSEPGVPVGFTDAVKRFYAKYTQFSGRASRSEYWWVALYLGAIYLVLSLLMAAGTDAYGEPTGFGVLATLLIVVFALGHIVPSIALGIRRLHDANFSGWFYLLGLIPYLGGLVLLVFAVLPSNPQGARFDR